jgi:hypothetical protein
MNLYLIVKCLRKNYNITMKLDDKLTITANSISNLYHCSWLRIKSIAIYVNRLKVEVRDYLENLYIANIIFPVRNYCALTWANSIFITISDYINQLQTHRLLPPVAPNKCLNSALENKYCYKSMNRI